MESVLRQRAISAFIFVTIVISLFALGKYGVMAILISVLCGTLYEICRLDKFTLIESLFILVAALGFVTVFHVVATYQIYLLIVALIFACLFHVILSVILINSDRPIFPVIKKSVFIYPILGFTLAIHSTIGEVKALQLILGTMLLIWVCDSGAYLVGRKIGKHKLFERVSPKKTWEGLMGSLVFTLVISYPIALLLPELSFTAWFLIAVNVVIFGTIGDLIQSKVKREFGVKDSGNLLPGHGGWWDRFDSFIFVLPFVLLLSTYF